MPFTLLRIHLGVGELKHGTCIARLERERRTADARPDRQCCLLQLDRFDDRSGDALACLRDHGGRRARIGGLEIGKKDEEFVAALAGHKIGVPRGAPDPPGGLIVALPGPDEDHNPETKASDCCGDGRTAGHSSRATGRSGALDPGPHGLARSGLVLCDLTAWRRLAGSDEARNLAQLSRHGKGPVGGEPAWTRRAGRRATRLEATWPLLPGWVPGAGAAPAR